MNILFISPSWPPDKSHNGIVSYIDNIRKGLSYNKEIETKVMTIDYLGEGDNNDIINLDTYVPYGFLKYHYLRTLFYYFVGSRFSRAIFVKKAHTALVKLKTFWIPDIVEIEDSFGMARVLYKELKIPTIIRLHGPWFLNGVVLGVKEDREYNKRVKLEIKALERAKGITSPSESALRLVREEFGIDLPQAVVIPNPAPNVLPSNIWTEEAHENNTILFVGRFDLHKGGDLILKACAKLFEENKSAKLIFIGPDTGIKTVKNTEIHFFEYIERFISNKDFLNRIEFLGKQSKNKIEELRGKCSITVIPSRFEVFPMTVLESIAHGSPTIACNTGGIPEIIKDGNNGLLFEPEDIENLYQQMKILLEDVDLAKKMSQAALKTVDKRFSRNIIAEKTKIFYKKFLDGY